MAETYESTFTRTNNDSDNPCVVGLAAELEVRRNRDTAGTVRNASSSRIERSSTCGARRTTEKAASAAAGGSRAAGTTISDRIWGGVGGGRSCGIGRSIAPAGRRFKPRRDKSVPRPFRHTSVQRRSRL